MAAILSRQPDHVRHEPIFVFPAAWPMSLCRSMLPQHTADPALCYLRSLRIRSTQARRRAGLRSFPSRPPSERVCPASSQTLPCAGAHSLSAAASAPTVVQSPSRHTAAAIYNMSDPLSLPRGSHQHGTCLIQPIPVCVACSSARVRRSLTITVDQFR